MEENHEGSPKTTADDRSLSPMRTTCDKVEVPRSTFEHRDGAGRGSTTVYISDQLPSQDNGVPVRTGMVRALSAGEPHQLLRQASTRACMSIAEEQDEDQPQNDNSHSFNSLAAPVDAPSPAVEVKSLNLNSEAPPFTPRRSVQPLPELPASSGKDEEEKTPFMQDLLDRLIRLELSLFPLRDIHAQIATLRQDVDFLLRSQRQQYQHNGHSQSPSPSNVSNASPLVNGVALPGAGAAAAAPSSGNNTNGELQHLSSQLNGLTSAVSHLMLAQQGQKQQQVPARPQQAPLSPSQQFPAVTPVRPSPATARSNSPTTPFSSNGPSHPRYNSGLEANASRMSSAASHLASPLPEANVSVNQKLWMPLATMLSPSLLGALLALPGLSAPTKIQTKAIPALLSTQDDILAQSTDDAESILSYGLPAVQLCSESPPASGGLTCLVVCATMERASQAQHLLHHLGSSQGIRTGVATSPSAAGNESSLARTRPHILIATPQAALDLLAKRIVGSEGSIRLLVLDESDTLMHTGQQDTVRSVVRLLPASQVAQTYDPWADTSTTPASREKTLGRQTAILGSTIPQVLLDFATQLQLREPVRVMVRKVPSNSIPSVGPSTPALNTVTQSLSSQAGLSFKGVRHFYLYVALSSDRLWKLEALTDLLVDAASSQAIVFCGSHEAVEAVSYKLASHNIDAYSIHDELGAAARSSIMSKFWTPPPSGAKKALVLCDRHCRTIPELRQVPLVANFDLPLTYESYMYHCSPAFGSGYSRPGAVVNIISSEPETEHLHRIERFHGVRMLEMPADAASIA